MGGQLATPSNASEWICALATEALMQSSNSHKVFIDKQCEGKCTVRVLNLWHKRQIKLRKARERREKEAAECVEVATGRQGDRGKHKTLELNNSPTACGSEKPEQRVAKKAAARIAAAGVTTTTAGAKNSKEQEIRT